MRGDWCVSAACRHTDPDLFHSDKPSERAQAKRICRGCPVRELCLAEALARREPFGVFGGQDAEERRRGPAPPRPRRRNRPPLPAQRVCRCGRAFAPNRQSHMRCAACSHRAHREDRTRIPGVVAAELDVLRRLREAGHSYATIARRLAVPEYAVSRACRLLGLGRK